MNRMMLTASNLIYHNLVGLNVKIAHSTDPTQTGLEGRVIDETSRTLTLSTSAGNKIVPKIHSRFAFYLPSEVVVEGSDIMLSPEERLKRLQRRRR
jgi:ribonuclease P protein subunit POP4